MAEDSMTVTLSGTETIQWIREQVRLGRFESEADLVAGTIAEWREEEANFQKWVEEKIGPRYDALEADPSSAITSEELLRRLEVRRQRRVVAA